MQYLLFQFFINNNNNIYIYINIYIYGKINNKKI